MCRKVSARERLEITCSPKENFQGWPREFVSKEALMAAVRERMQAALER